MRFHFELALFDDNHRSWEYDYIRFVFGIMPLFTVGLKFSKDQIPVNETNLLETTIGLYVFGKKFSKQWLKVVKSEKS